MGGSEDKAARKAAKKLKKVRFFEATSLVGFDGVWAIGYRIIHL